MRREIGIGKATIIDELEISWHGSNLVQVFKNVLPNRFLKLSEGGPLQPYAINKLNWILPEKLCSPFVINQ